MLSESERLQYLAAIGIDVWSLRNVPDLAESAAPTEDQPDAVSGELPAPWQLLQDNVRACTRCELHQTRTQTVFGTGNRDANWMIIGEAPGADEDRQGEPFVGAAGKLLNEILRAAGLDRSSVFIANILKCRPPGNRNPHQAEAEACSQHLEQQIALVQPKLILAVGAVAAHQLLQSDKPVGKLRGMRHLLPASDIPVVVTYHPAYLLRSPIHKRDVWNDLCLAQRCIEGLQD